MHNEIVEGMETLYEDVIVEIPFHYAGAETKEEKFQLEYDAADFFTSSYSHEIQDPNTNNVIRKVFGDYSSIAACCLGKH